MLKLLKSTWATIVVTAAATSAVWAHFLAMKQERIDFWKEKAEAGPKEQIEWKESLEKLNQQIAPLALTFPMDPLDGHVLLGGMGSAPTRITFLVADAQNYINQKKYDVAEETAKQVEELAPSLVAANFIRWQLANARSEPEAVIKHGNIVIASRPTDQRTHQIYTSVANALLGLNRKKEAENLTLKLVNSFPTNTEYAAQFEQIFGYRPTIRTNRMQ